MQPPKPSTPIQVGEDFSHEHRMRGLLKDMKATCRAKGIEAPLMLVTDDQLNVAIPPQLEDLLMIAAFPGCEILIAHGMEPGKFEKHERRVKGKPLTEYHFPSRGEAVGTAMEILGRTLANMRGTGGGHA